MTMKKVLFGALGVFLSTSVLGATPPGLAGPEEAMSSRCQEMMAQREQMMSRMESEQKELDRLVEAMDEARGDAKINAMGEVVQKLAAQRSAMMRHMMEMQPRMMAHMMQHRERGEGGMASCPMMKAMKQPPSEDER